MQRERPGPAGSSSASSPSPRSFNSPEWEEWLNLLLGVWLIFAPWIVGFAGVVAAMRTHVALGVLIALFSAWELWAVRHETSAHA